MIGHRQTSSSRLKDRGFTIVELLIVIVVIAILAAIVIIAYTGIQNKAHAAAAQAASNTIAKLLTNNYTTNGTYPNDLSTIYNGNPMPTTDGSSYAYHPGAGNASFCVTVTNGNSSYKVTDTATQPTAGGCPGDGQGGVAPITNLATNPSFETDTSGWASYLYVGAISRVTTTPYSGTGRLSAPCNNTGTTPRVTTILSNLTAGSTFFVSARVRLDGQAPSYGLLQIKARSAGTEVSIPVSYQPTWAPDANGWMYLSATVTVPAGSDGLGINPGVVTSATCSTGILGVDTVMITAGSTTQNYADGSSPNWIWNGATNVSTSTGPPQ
jgi:prepilin-type N-terminal cleavage/methylation domain-containing protein